MDSGYDIRRLSDVTFVLCSEAIVRILVNDGTHRMYARMQAAVAIEISARGLSVSPRERAPKPTRKIPAETIAAGTMPWAK